MKTPEEKMMEVSNALREAALDVFEKHETPPDTAANLCLHLAHMIYSTRGRPKGTLTEAAARFEEACSKMGLTYPLYPTAS